MKPFEIRDCALLTRMSGLSAAVNLRELRDRLAICNPNVIYHHFCETPMTPTFDNPDYRNDFAVWVKLHLGDRVLAERLGILDPYRFPDLEDLRAVTIDLIDERLSELWYVPTAPNGAEFHFTEATTVVFDTGRRIEHPRELATAIRGMTNSSIFFHYLEAQRREPPGMDDFSSWLLEFGAEYEKDIMALCSIDFTFFTLSELKSELVGLLSARGETP
ncbi:DUF5752 family protein [Geobacter sp. SVR]|uniref:DUF5752 family protein n=1 Tax=Geobacter sp. SVR TaxID=2495594 RepID=UPI00143EF5F2|nr:DUF5752 family protein [Geobacter sp. SVR]BCS54937.1 hypothetical protein GSVR_32450 [Geobacter sp. SVR]GCF86136.1 hypothetical protein GSbR_27360 [Geobacter sp. SVR]